MSAGAERTQAEALPEVTPEMVAAGCRTWAELAWAREPDVIAAIYHAMRLARPLAEGPGL